MAEEKKLPIKPFLLGAGLGILAFAAIGFNWFGLPGFGYQTYGGAESMAKARAEAGVIGARVPICLDNALSDLNETKMAEFVEATRSFDQSKVVREGGWAIMPGVEKSDRTLESTCAEA